MTLLKHSYRAGAVVPEPGYKPTPLDKHDECMRQAFSCCTGIEPKDIPYISTIENHPLKFWNEWFDVANMFGWNMRKLRPSNARLYAPDVVKALPYVEEPPEGYWIGALYFPMEGYGHAVTMKDREYYWDEYRGSVYRWKNHLVYGIEVAPLD